MVYTTNTYYEYFTLSMRILLLFISLLFSAPSKSGEQQLEFQTSGLVGLGHAFYSYTFINKHTLSIGAGYVPELADHDDMTLLSLKYRYTPTKSYPFISIGQEIMWKPYSFSVTVLRGEDNDIYKTLPDDIPKDYYLPSARRVIFSMQTNFVLQDGVEFYWDWSVLDIGLINYVRNFEFYRDNYRFLGLEGILSYGIGFRVDL